MLKKANRTVMNMGLAALLVPAALTFSTTSASANDGGAAPAPVQEKGNAKRTSTTSNYYY